MASGCPVLPRSTLPLRSVRGVAVLLSPASLASIDESVLLVDFWLGEDGSGHIAATGVLSGLVDVSIFIIVSPLDDDV